MWIVRPRCSSHVYDSATDALSKDPEESGAGAVESTF